MSIEDKKQRVVLKEELVLFSFIQFNDYDDKNLLICVKRVIPDSLSKMIEISLKDSFVKRTVSEISRNYQNELLKNHKRYICFNTSKNRMALYEYHSGKASFFTYGEDGIVIDENHSGLTRGTNVKILTECKNFATSFKLLN